MNKLLCVMCVLFLIGCATGHRSSNYKHKYDAPEIEASWIREGQPIKFDNKLWYPVDDIESLTDNEVLPIGKYNDVDFFVDKIDIKPYSRLYTKFGRNKYRYFKQQ